MHQPARISTNYTTENIMNDFAWILPFISLVCIAGLLAYFYNQIDKRPEHVIKAAPGLLITVGIGFTFLGICLAFYNFNANDIEKDLPALIGHIKYAFLGSLLGVTCAVILKIKILFSRRYDSEDTTIEELLAKKASILQSFSTALASKNNESITSLLQTLIVQSHDNSRIMAIWQEKTLKYIKEFTQGTDENPWLTVSRTRHEETINALELLRTTMSNFYDQQMQKNTQIFTDAISKTIQKTNSDLSSQLGANFQKFNFGLDSMLEWQKNYKAQIDRWISQEDERLEKFGDYTRVLESIRLIIIDTADKLKNIGNVTEQLGYASSSLEDSLEFIKNTHNELQACMQQTSTSIAKTLDDLPNIKAVLADYTNSLQALPAKYSDLIDSLANKQSAHAGKLTNELQRVAKHHIDQLNDLALGQQQQIENLTQHHLKNQASLLDIPQSHSKTLDSLAQSQTAYFIKFNDELRLSFETILHELIQTIQHAIHQQINPSQASTTQVISDVFSSDSLSSPSNSTDMSMLQKDRLPDNLMQAINRLLGDLKIISEDTLIKDIQIHGNLDSLNDKALKLSLNIAMHNIDGSPTFTAAKLLSFQFNNETYAFPNSNSLYDPDLKNWYIVNRREPAFGIKKLAKIERDANNVIHCQTKGIINLTL